MMIDQPAERWPAKDLERVSSAVERVHDLFRKAPYLHSKSQIPGCGFVTFDDLKTLQEYVSWVLEHGLAEGAPTEHSSWSDEDYKSARDCMLEKLKGYGWSVSGRHGEDKQFDDAFQHAVGILALTSRRTPAVTADMVDNALNAWFASPPSETDQGLERSMRAALEAAIGSRYQSGLADEDDPTILKQIIHDLTDGITGTLQKDELQATYNDLSALQDQTDTVPLTTALDAVGLALEIVGGRTPAETVDWKGAYKLALEKTRNSP